MQHAVPVILLVHGFQNLTTCSNLTGDLKY